MQLTEKKLKQMVKEAVLEALTNEDVLSTIISECITTTFSEVKKQLSENKTNYNKQTPKASQKNDINKASRINEHSEELRMMMENEFKEFTTIDNKNQPVQSSKPSKFTSYDDESDESNDPAEKYIMKMIGVK